MFVLLPYEADVTMWRWPTSNFILLGAIALASLALLLGGPEAAFGGLILDGWSLTGLLGYSFVHADLFHLLGNLLFLWVFGNAVCAKVGNLAYIPLFLLFGVLAGALHNLLDGQLAVGASGAINGVIGLFLIYYPQNNIRCLWFLFIRGGSFSISSAWLILLWLVFDLYGAVAGSGGVAYWAHVDGLAAGVGVGAATLHFQWVEMTDTERSLLDVFAGRR